MVLSHQRQSPCLPPSSALTLPLSHDLSFSSIRPLHLLFSCSSPSSGSSSQGELPDLRTSLAFPAILRVTAQPGSDQNPTLVIHGPEGNHSDPLASLVSNLRRRETGKAVKRGWEGGSWRPQRAPASPRDLRRETSQEPRMLHNQEVSGAGPWTWLQRTQGFLASSRVNIWVWTSCLILLGPNTHQ